MKRQRSERADGVGFLFGEGAAGRRERLHQCRLRPPQGRPGPLQGSRRRPCWAGTGGPYGSAEQTSAVAQRPRSRTRWLQANDRSELQVLAWNRDHSTFQGCGEG